MSVLTKCSISFTSNAIVVVVTQHDGMIIVLTKCLVLFTSNTLAVVVVVQYHHIMSVLATSSTLVVVVVMQHCNMIIF